jgi:hypothetical protein
MSSHSSARTTFYTLNQCSRCKAISGDSAAMPFHMHESVGRVIPKASAASVTVMPKAGNTSSRNVSPGCCGLCLLLISYTSDIVLVIDSYLHRLAERSNSNCRWLLPTSVPQAFQTEAKASIQADSYPATPEHDSTAQIA